ncbi:Aspartyl protease family protein [Camellia lanceoleosa]|uniref:Aspartyl protease family protein n=1 Tax=Camellia lanceoleosa TaxID=1840588 RepID=A0ACC0FI96_9ERIC|nr:Aspartyl protease family protein [Camellia lanceoleosa]
MPHLNVEKVFRTSRLRQNSPPPTPRPPPPSLRSRASQLAAPTTSPQSDSEPPKDSTVFCYKQKQPIFDPSQLSSATNTPPLCSTNTCVYGIGYIDGSTSQGFFASETLTLTPSDVFPNFLFGCGENNQGVFAGDAGFIGLGRSRLSLVSQISSKYGNYFSYCLPSTPSCTGFLTFGKGGRSSAGSSLQFAPLLSKSKDPSSYYVDIIGIKVGGKTLSISQSVFKTPGSIIDSGTVITRLPPAAYDALKTAFRQHMTQYRLAKPMSGFDICYHVKKNTTLKIPSISFVFGGNIEVGSWGLAIEVVLNLA